MLLTREQALKVPGRKFKLVKVAELDGELRIASLSAGGALRVRELKASAEGHATSDRDAAKVVLSDAVVDANGEPFFDVPSLEKFLDRISLATMNLLVNEVTALTRPAADAPETEGPPSGNSVSSPSAASPTGSA